MRGVHEGFEGASEEIRIDGGFGPGSGVFARREAEAGERVEQERGEEFVADVRVTRAAFER